MKLARACCGLLVALLAGCDTASPSPGGGSELKLGLRTPFRGDHALLVTITGPAPATSVRSAGSGYVVYSRSTGNITRVAVFGAINDGDLLRFSVPDAAQAGAWSATVTDAADSLNRTRSSLVGYSLTVSR
jgi:hypothetical protein